ncbi:2-phytyl-1 4-beta-naphthoquinone methyltransferase chloroplastic [Bienertia sinuspersici]
MSKLQLSPLSLYRPPLFSPENSIFRHRKSTIKCSNDRQALFNRIAPVYDNLNDLLSLGQHRVWKRMAVSWSGWKEGDALNLPFRGDCFDAITMGYGLRNVIDKERAMQEIFRVLKPGCKASMLDFNKSKQPITGFIQEWMIDNVVVPAATGYGLAEEYKYLKSSIQQFLTGEELEQLAHWVGFSDAKFYEIAGGLMGNLVVTR